MFETPTSLKSTSYLSGTCLAGRLPRQLHKNDNDIKWPHCKRIALKHIEVPKLQKLEQLPILLAKNTLPTGTNACTSGQGADVNLTHKKNNSMTPAATLGICSIFLQNDWSSLQNGPHQRFILAVCRCPGKTRCAPDPLVPDRSFGRTHWAWQQPQSKTWKRDEITLTWHFYLVML